MEDDDVRVLVPQHLLAGGLGRSLLLSVARVPLGALMFFAVDHALLQTVLPHHGDDALPAAVVGQPGGAPPHLRHFHVVLLV